MFPKFRRVLPCVAFAPALVAFSPAQAEDSQGGGTWITGLVVLVVLLIFFVALRIWLDRRTKQDRVFEAAEAEAESEPESPEWEHTGPATVEEIVDGKELVPDEPDPSLVGAEEEQHAGAHKPAPDDLKVVEGIGPKISGLMNAAGIYTFHELADSEVSSLQRILDDAGITIANPATWPEQAKLAAEGRWQELETLQDQLKGGRRV